MLPSQKIKMAASYVKNTKKNRRHLEFSRHFECSRLETFFSSSKSLRKF
jgi:hypothetical protein